MKYLEIPRYQELSVSNIWSIVREVQALSSYFPTLQPYQLPDQDFMFSVLFTARYDELHKIIQNARKHRSIKALEANDTVKPLVQSPPLNDNNFVKFMRGDWTRGILLTILAKK